jgi:shikimate dehydrogenase
MHFKEFVNSELINHPHFLLIGNPVEHSISPMMHGVALKHHGIDVNYIAISVEFSELHLLASHFNKPEFLGANITIPYKMDLIPYMDELSSTAQLIGAINTIVKFDTKLYGDNTDAHGFKVPLMHYTDLATDRAIIFGSGGATKAIIFALNDFGFNEVCIVTRKQNISVDQPNLIVCSYDSWPHFIEEATLIINATPLGMAPNFDSSPVKDYEIDYLSGKLCYDIVYNPRETKFLIQAKNAGGIPLGGLDMLIYQGDESFYKWTNKRFPISLVKTKLNELFSI